MTSSQSFLPGSLLATIAAWMAITASCGGRTSTDSTDTANSGGTNDHAGTSTTTSSTTTTGTTTAGTTSGGFTTGGSSSGGNSSGGSTGQGGTAVTTTGGSAGTATCQNVGCPNIACGPGSQTIIVPGACCPSCAPCNVACAGCVPGSHLQPVLGQCCGICVGDPISCEAGKRQYEVTRAQLLDKYSFGCKIDSDCTLAGETNLCTARCGVAILASNVGNWTSNLSSSAQSNCSACPPMPIPPCLPQMALCRMNRCVTGP